ncbi:MAG: toxin-antitoxin system HicB family antitoxin [Cyanobacteria bacterium P01_F01_bin.33]
MEALSVRLPESIQRHICEIAKQEGVSIDQFICSAVAEKIAAILTEEYIQARAERAKPDKAQKLLAEVSNREPLTGDES